VTLSLTRLDRDDGVVELHIVLRGEGNADQLSRVAADLVQQFDDVPTKPPGEMDLEPPVRIEVGPRRVFAHGVEVELTRLEFDLLLFLCRNAGRVCDRARLMTQVWRASATGRGRTVDVHIRKLRGKIEVVAGSITTIRGVGYRFDGAGLVRIDEEWAVALR
jgi:DNA-binding response OmpR family regulator